LTLLAEGAALLAGFQMMMFYELQLAPVDEHHYQVADPPRSCNLQSASDVFCAGDAPTAFAPVCALQTACMPPEQSLAYLSDLRTNFENISGRNLDFTLVFKKEKYLIPDEID